MSGSFQPNVLFSLANSFGAGQQYAQNAQRNALFFQEAERERQDREAIRALGPRLAQGDQGAIGELAAVSPEAAMRWQDQLRQTDTSRRQQALQAAQWFGQGAQSLLALPEAQRPQAYAALRQEAQGLGFGASLPEAYPGEAALTVAGRRALTVQQQLTNDRQEREYRENQIVPASMPMGAVGAPPPPAGGPNVPAQREAVNWQADARREALETLTGPALDARLNEIAEQAGQAMGRRAGGSTPSFAGAGAGPVPLMRGNRPFTEGLPAGYQWGQGAGGQRVAIPIPGVPVQPRDQPSYDTVQTAEGVYRVNSRDPNDRVRIGERPKSATDGRLPTSLAKMDAEDIDAIQAAAGMSSDLATFRSMIQRGELPLSGFGNVANRVRNTAGFSTQESRNLASFEASLERLRNESLRLNKGVQTEGDSQRAWNELVANINDPGVVAQRLSEIERINQRALQLKLGEMNRRRAEFNAAPITLEAAGGVQSTAFGQGATPPGEAPAPAAAAPAPPAPPASPAGGGQGLPPLPPGFQLVR